MNCKSQNVVSRWVKHMPRGCQLSRVQGGRLLTCLERQPGPRTHVGDPSSWLWPGPILTAVTIAEGRFLSLSPLCLLREINPCFFKASESIRESLWHRPMSPQTPNLDRQRQTTQPPVAKEQPALRGEELAIRRDLNPNLSERKEAEPAPSPGHWAGPRRHRGAHAQPSEPTRSTDSA